MDLGYTAAPTGRARPCPIDRWTPISEGVRFDGHPRREDPDAFQRRGGRKRIVAPDGSEFPLTTKSQLTSGTFDEPPHDQKTLGMLATGASLMVPFRPISVLG
jgi:hypothetical protein